MDRSKLASGGRDPFAQSASGRGALQVHDCIKEIAHAYDRHTADRSVSPKGGTGIKSRGTTARARVHKMAQRSNLQATSFESRKIGQTSTILQVSTQMPRLGRFSIETALSLAKRHRCFNRA